MFAKRPSSWLNATPSPEPGAAEASNALWDPFTFAVVNNNSTRAHVMASTRHTVQVAASSCAVSATPSVNGATVAPFGDSATSGDAQATLAGDDATCFALPVLPALRVSGKKRGRGPGGATYAADALLATTAPSVATPVTDPDTDDVQSLQRASCAVAHALVDLETQAAAAADSLAHLEVAVLARLGALREDLGRRVAVKRVQLETQATAVDAALERAVAAAPPLQAPSVVAFSELGLQSSLTFVRPPCVELVYPADPAELLDVQLCDAMDGCDVEAADMTFEVVTGTAGHSVKCTTPGGHVTVRLKLNKNASQRTLRQLDQLAAWTRVTWRVADGRSAARLVTLAAVSRPRGALDVLDADWSVPLDALRGTTLELVRVDVERRPVRPVDGRPVPVVHVLSGLTPSDTSQLYAALRDSQGSRTACMRLSLAACMRNCYTPALALALARDADVAGTWDVEACLQLVKRFPVVAALIVGQMPVPVHVLRAVVVDADSSVAHCSWTDASAVNRALCRGDVREAVGATWKSMLAAPWLAAQLRKWSTWPQAESHLEDTVFGLLRAFGDCSWDAVAEGLVMDAVVHGVTAAAAAAPAAVGSFPADARQRHVLTKVARAVWNMATRHGQPPAAAVGRWQTMLWWLVSTRPRGSCVSVCGKTETETERLVDAGLRLDTARATGAPQRRRQTAMLSLLSASVTLAPASASLQECLSVCVVLDDWVRQGTQTGAREEQVRVHALLACPALVTGPLCTLQRLCSTLVADDDFAFTTPRLTAVLRLLRALAAHDKDWRCSVPAVVVVRLLSILYLRFFSGFSCINVTTVTLCWLELAVKLEAHEFCAAARTHCAGTPGHLPVQPSTDGKGCGCVAAFLEHVCTQFVAASVVTASATLLRSLTGAAAEPRVRK